VIYLVQKAVKFNCREALLMSGECPDTFQVVKSKLDKLGYNDYIQYILDLCKYILNWNLLPHTNLGLLKYDELKRLKEFNASMGLMLESTSPRLFEKGGVHENSPSKLPAKRIKHIEDAGKLKIPFTTGLLLGIGENFKERINDLYLIKNIHAKYGHIQEVIIQNFIYKKGIPYKPKNSLSIDEMLKITGIAKLIFENEISVQIPPNLIKGYEEFFLDMGIDDFGGISPFTKDYINPKNPWPQIEKLNQICERRGYKLKERLPIYDKYIEKTEFLSETIKKKIDSIT
jgi:FO synthase subunit 1